MTLFEYNTNCIVTFSLENCRNDWEDNSAPSKARKSTSGGIAICLSACDDDKMAADTTVRRFRNSVFQISFSIFYLW